MAEVGGSVAVGRFCLEYQVLVELGWGWGIVTFLVLEIRIHCLHCRVTNFAVFALNKIPVGIIIIAHI